MPFDKVTLTVRLRLNPFLTPGGQWHQQEPAHQHKHELFHKLCPSGGPASKESKALIIKPAAAASKSIRLIKIKFFIDNFKFKLIKKRASVKGAGYGRDWRFLL
jgi:hypothetical protein